MDFFIPIEKVQEEIIDIQRFLQTEVETDPANIQAYGDEISIKIQTLNVYMARTGELLANAEYHLNKKIESEVIHDLIESMGQIAISAASQKQFIASQCSYEQYLVKLCERANKTCTHQIDSFRSLLSKHKEEYRYSKYTGQ